MAIIRIALAAVPYPESRDHSVALAQGAIGDAGHAGADVVCFPECLVPGYRGLGKIVAPPDADFLERAWTSIAKAAAAASVGVVLGTERVTTEGVIASALVISRDGVRVRFQDKVQIDPSEDTIYIRGRTRRVFQLGELTFGVAICHEGWRYPETVRFAVRQGAHLVFHPHFEEGEPDATRPTDYGERERPFHEKAVLCRAAENTAYFATVNHATARGHTTCAVARPDGTLQAFLPHGQAGLLVAEIDTALATGYLAKRLQPIVSD